MIRRRLHLQIQRIRRIRRNTRMHRRRRIVNLPLQLLQTTRAMRVVTRR